TLSRRLDNTPAGTGGDPATPKRAAFGQGPAKTNVTVAFCGPREVNRDRSPVRKLRKIQPIPSPSPRFSSVVPCERERGPRSDARSSAKAGVTTTPVRHVQAGGGGV